MKRLMICLLMGCGAPQGDEPEIATEGSGAMESKPQTAPEAVAPEASHPTAIAPLIERRLYPHKFSSSSHLENDWNKFQENYLATYLGDDDPTTSWTDGKSDVGLGETVTVEHTKLEDATKVRLEVRNGYQKTPRLFTRNARARDISLKLLPSGATSKHTLTDSEGWQSIAVEQTKGPLQGYEIRFDSVYKGTHYEDLVISDIQTYVTAHTADNPSFEITKRKRLLDWVAGRKLAAKTFKEAAKGSIPVAPVYEQKRVNSMPPGDEGIEDPQPFDRAAKKWAGAKAHTSLKAEVLSGFETWHQVRVSATDARKIPQADAFRHTGSWSASEIFEIGDEPAINLPIPGLLAYFSSRALKRVYVENSPVSASLAIKAKAPGCRSKDGDTRYYYTPTQTGPLRSLLIVACGMHESRDGFYPGSYWQILTYSGKGQLEYLFDFYSANQFTWVNRGGSAFLKKVARVSTFGAYDTEFLAK